MRRSRPALWILGGMIAAAVSAGCAVAPVPQQQGNRTGKAVDAKGVPVHAPFYYEPLIVRNACFVESVRLYDQYLDRRVNDEGGWVKVLQWGSRESDDKVGLGHAVAVFT